MRLTRIAALWGTALLTLPAAPLAAQAPAPAKKPAASAATSSAQKVSYQIGRNFGEGLKFEPFKFDAKALAQGVLDGLAGTKSPYTEEEIQQAMERVQKDVEARIAKTAEEQLKAGQQFLAENGKKQGVKTTKTGLQYQVLKPGTGATPKATDIVKVHYEGSLVDGTRFDSSYEREEPLVLFMSGPQGVIPGWREALQLMKVGSKWKLFIPAELAYGVQPPRASPIPPNAVLIFTVELLGIEKPQEPPEELEEVPPAR